MTAGTLGFVAAILIIYAVAQAADWYITLRRTK